ncbi:MAG: shikimate dehydrogenase family protein [Gaiellaceae bacterium]
MRLDDARRSIEGTTRLVGIIGSPVSHSLSPRMHNAAFAELELDWAYVPLPVSAAAVGDAVSGLRGLGLAGANVTIPHKQAVLEYCDVVEPSAARSCSANTLLVDDGSIIAASTDGEGVAAGLEPTGASCVVLGAGGASRPVIVALSDAGAATITIAGRRPEAAAALASELGAVCSGSAIRADQLWPPATRADIVVNATPIKDETLVALSSDQQIVDLAYRTDGAPTAFIAAARSAGCERIIDGLEFLVRQGALSFERWTGQSAPLDVMRAAVMPSLGG